LRELGLRAGDTVRYHLSAKDNNAVSGPSESQSAAFLLRVASYEEEHERMERELAEAQKELLGLLAEETLLRENLNAAPVDWEGLDRSQAALRHRTAAQAKRFDALVQKIRTDPLMDEAAAIEYEGVARNLTELERDAMARAEEAVRSRQKESAAPAMDEIVSELERLSLLAEDAQQARRMRDVLARQDDMTRAAENLLDELSSRPAGAFSDEEMKRWAETMAEIARLTREISEQIQKMPKELPEDFVNQPGVKNLRFDEVQSAAEELRRALSAGSSAGALAAAKQLLDRLKEIQKNLEDSARQSPGSSSWYGDELMGDIGKRQKELQGLIERQEKIKSGTDALSRSALAGLLERQKTLMGEVSVDLDRWDPRFREFQERFSSSVEPVFRLQNMARFQRAEALLRSAREELGRRDLQNTPAGLEELHSKLQEVEGALREEKLRLTLEDGGKPSANGTARTLRPAELPQETRRVYELLEGLEKTAGELGGDLDRQIRKLRTPPRESEFLSSDERKSAQELSSAQRMLKDDTSVLRQDLRELARKTATLSPRLDRRLFLAAQAMTEAADRLEEESLRKAADAEETALRYLRETEQEMQSAAQNAAGMESGAGRSPAGSIRVLSGSGAAGARLEPVRIPRAEDYRPPREFREELLKSMREKYPEIYEDIVQDYYEHWAK